MASPSDESRQTQKQARQAESASRRVAAQTPRRQDMAKSSESKSLMCPFSLTGSAISRSLEFELRLKSHTSKASSLHTNPNEPKMCPNTELLAFFSHPPPPPPHSQVLTNQTQWPQMDPPFERIPYHGPFDRVAQWSDLVSGHYDNHYHHYYCHYYCRAQARHTSARLWLSIPIHSWCFFVQSRQVCGCECD